MHTHYASARARCARLTVRTLLAIFCSFALLQPYGPAPVGAEPIVRPITLGASSAVVQPGDTITWTVSLDAPSSQDRWVAITTDNAQAFPDLPTYVVVPAGCSTALFGATAGEIQASTTATVTASFDGSAASTTVSVVMPIAVRG